MSVAATAPEGTKKSEVAQNVGGS